MHGAKAIAFVAAATFVATGCGASKSHTDSRKVVAAAAATVPMAPTVPRASTVSKARVRIQALVTAPSVNRLVLVGLPGGHVIRQVPVPGDPTYVAASGAVVVVVSSDSGTVTLLDRESLRVIKVFHGFASPHIPAISPDGQYAYVTDDGSGELAVIGLYDDKLISRVFVGLGAHHLAFSPGERQVWVALSQAAQTFTLLSTVTPSGSVDPGHPHVIGVFHPGFLAHDVLFSPGGKQVWITSADTSYVGVFSSRTRRLLFRVPGGAPPQHVVFANGFAYITSGYGGTIEQVDPYSGRVIRRVSAPYGSFDLDAAGGYVVTASLFRGTLAIYTSRLRLLHVSELAPSTEDVALSTSSGGAE